MNFKPYFGSNNNSNTSTNLTVCYCLLFILFSTDINYIMFI